MTSTSSRLRLDLLGPPAVTVDGVALAVDTRKAIALLALLAVTPSPPTRDRVAALLWPEADANRARSALRRTLSTLRTALDDRWISADRHRISLDREGVELDMEVSVAASRIEHGHSDHEACPDCVEPLEAASACHRGRFMEGFTLRDAPDFETWCYEVAADEQRHLRRILERLSVAHAAAGDFAAAAAAARRRLALDPLDETAHRHLMLALAHLGDRAGFIEAYRSCLETLENELGVPPLEETTELYQAILEEDLPRFPGVTRQPAPPMPARPGRIVGRDEELAWALDAVRDPRVRAVSVQGPVGIGKTRLLEEVVASVGTAVTARGYESEQDIAYGAIAQLLAATGHRVHADLPEWVVSEVARIAPEIAGPFPERSPALDTAESERRLVEAVALYLSGLGAEALIAVDDAHWIDDASVAALSYLARRDGSPTLFITVRPGEIGSKSPLLGLLEREGSAAKTLAPLDEEAAADLYRLANRRTSVPNDLMKKSGGIPLYLTVDLSEDAAYRLALTRRVRRLPQLTWQVLAAAAIADGPFDLDWLRAVSGRSEEEVLSALEDATEAGLLVASAGEVLEFAHEMIATVVTETLSMMRRRVLHRRAGERAAESRTVRGMASAARHMQMAGINDAAARHAFEAAHLCLDLFALGEARQHLQTALALGHAEQGRIHLRLGEIAAAEGSYTEASLEFEAAAARLEGHELAEVEWRIGEALMRLGQWELAEAAFRRAEPAHPRPALLHADWAWLHRRLGADDLARRRADQAMSAAETPVERARALNMLGLVTTDPSEAERHLRAGLEIGGELERVAALNNLGHLMESSGRIGEALQATEEALDLAGRIGHRHRQAALHNRVADLEHRLGDEDASQRSLRRAVEIFAMLDASPDRMNPEIWLLNQW